MTIGFLQQLQILLIDDLIKKKIAIRDKNISGIADPVIKAIGNKIKSREKKITSIFKDLSVNRDLKGDKKLMINIVSKHTS